jgi:hypothetical protein
MEKNLKAEIDKITSDTELNELLEYIEKRRNSILPTLHKALEPFFDQHPGTRYCILGGYRAGDYECTGEYFVLEEGYSDLMERLDDAGKLKKYPKDQIINCFIDDSAIENFDNLLWSTADFPEITEEAAYRSLKYSPGNESIFIYDYQKNKVIEETYYNG